MKDKNNTKSKIVDAMYKLIATEGYEKASIGRLCETIGITKAAVYYYFKSKEDILLEVVKKSHQDDFSTLLDNVNNSHNKDEYKEQIFRFGYDFIELYENDSEYRKVCYEIDIQIHRIPKVKEIVDGFNIIYNEVLVEMLERGVSLNVFEADSININAQYLQTVIMGLDKAVLFQLPVSPREVWQYSIDQIL